jgi:heat shock 70kDa protein 4
VAFKKGQLQVLAHGWDRNLGGRNFDDVLYDHFVKEFNAKYKLDVNSSPRASFRLRLACEKVSLPEDSYVSTAVVTPRACASGVSDLPAVVRASLQLKKVLSANAEARITVESLGEDVDASGAMTREDFEEMAKPLLTRLTEPNGALKKVSCCLCSWWHVMPSCLVFSPCMLRMDTPAVTQPRGQYHLFFCLCRR